MHAEMYPHFVGASSARPRAGNARPYRGWYEFAGVRMVFWIGLRFRPAEPGGGGLWSAHPTEGFL